MLSFNLGFEFRFVGFFGIFGFNLCFEFRFLGFFGSFGFVGFCCFFLWEEFRSLFRWSMFFADFFMNFLYFFFFKVCFILLWIKLLMDVEELLVWVFFGLCVERLSLFIFLRDFWNRWRAFGSFVDFFILGLFLYFSCFIDLLKKFLYFIVIGDTKFFLDEI